MNWVKRLFCRFLSVLRDQFTHPYVIHIVEEELPRKLQKRTLYVVQEDGFAEHAAMICPCGCGRILLMNMIPDERPCWRLVKHEDGTTSLHPSVWRMKDCKSHFWFRHGRVYWCRDGRPWWGFFFLADSS